MRKVMFVSGKNYLSGTACCIAALCVSVFSFTIDLSPVALGNTWVYRRAVPGILWFPPHDYIRTITVVNVTKRGQDSLVFDVTYHDSGSDSTYRVDSIVKTSTSIGPAGALSLYFRISKIDTALISGYYFLRNDTVVYAAGGRSSSPFGASFDTSVYMDNVGLVYHFSQSNFRESYYQDGDALISFTPGTSSTKVSQGFKGISQASYSRSSQSPGFQRLILVNTTSNNHLPLPAELFDGRGRLMKNVRYGSASGIFYYYRADCGKGSR